MKEKKSIIIIGVIIIGAISAGRWALCNQKDIAYNDYQVSCGDIWCVQSIIVRADSILIEFDTNLGGFQIIHMIENDGTVIPLEYGSLFILEIGKKIGWGDGDHVSTSIALEDIKDNVAFVIIGDEHRPPPSLKHLEYSKFRKCKIYLKWP